MQQHSGGAAQWWGGNGPEKLSSKGNSMECPEDDEEVGAVADAAGDAAVEMRMVAAARNVEAVKPAEADVAPPALPPRPKRLSTPRRGGAQLAPPPRADESSNARPHSFRPKPK